MSGADRKRCVVTYATRGRQHLWTVDLPAGATIAEAIAAARQIATGQIEAQAMRDIPWDSAPVGIFGELRERSEKPRDGDRVEIYRPLQSDPRDRRRERVRNSRKAQPRLR